ncbi:MAG: ABC transporter substrate-binding protein [Candidatus Hydrogenedentota bacterium]|nr:MAG: ABC transporter substrate-binding protein [Candidatus Hydrogenedentota bacterium]
MHQRRIVLLFLFLFLATAPSRGAETSPGAIIEQNAAKAVAAIQKRSQHSSLDVGAIRTIFIETMEPLFDYREMTLRTLGRYARKYGKDRKGIEELTGVFREFLRQLFRTTLLPKTEFEHLKEVRVTDELIKGRYARVKTQSIVETSGETSVLDVNYMLVRHGKTWQIYDMEIDGYGIVGSYRSQFASVLKNHGLKDLIQRLREKTAEMKREETSKKKTS